MRLGEPHACLNPNPSPYLGQAPADISPPRPYISTARPVRAFGVGGKVTGSTRSSEGLDPRRRRLLYHAWHRGTREMDLIMGRFADTAIATLNDAELAEFEHLSNAPDPDLYAWISGKRPVEPGYDTAVFRRLRDFAEAGGK